MLGDDRTLHTAGGLPFVGYVAGDEAASGAVLILHEWWGLKGHNRGWADRLAEAGFRALAIDLYDGRVTGDREEAAAWMRGLDPAAVEAKLVAALDTLAAGGRQIATLGFSLGGRHAFAAALLRPDVVAATVAGYCRMPTDEEVARLPGPLLAVYAERERSWPEKQRLFEAAMAGAGRTTESVCFDAAHGFMDPESRNFDPAAAEATWHLDSAIVRHSAADSVPYAALASRISCSTYRKYACAEIRSPPCLRT